MAFWHRGGCRGDPDIMVYFFAPQEEWKSGMKLDMAEALFWTTAIMVWLVAGVTAVVYGRKNAKRNSDRP